MYLQNWNIYLFFSLFILFNIGCDKSKTVLHRKFPENSKEAQIKLEDSLGMVTVYVPITYDTVISWVNYSDCGKPCDKKEYRMQPKLLPVRKESGFFLLSHPQDSTNQLTITHGEYFPFHNSDTSKDLIRHFHIKSQIESNPFNPPIIFDTIEKIGDRYFSIFMMEKSDTIQSKKLTAVTTIAGNRISFEYELITRKNDSITKNFINNSLDLIKTIHISKGQ